MRTKCVTLFCFSRSRYFGNVSSDGQSRMRYFPSIMENINKAYRLSDRRFTGLLERQHVIDEDLCKLLAAQPERKNGREAASEHKRLIWYDFAAVETLNRVVT